MSLQQNKKYEFNSIGKSSRIDHCCPECGSMVTTKYIYICKTVHYIENKASVSVGNTVLWSNNTVARKVVEYRL